MWSGSLRSGRSLWRAVGNILGEVGTISGDTAPCGLVKCSRMCWGWGAGWNRTIPPGGEDILGKDPQLHTNKRKSQLASAGLHKWECQGSETGYSTVLAI